MPVDAPAPRQSRKQGSTRGADGRRAHLAGKNRATGRRRWRSPWQHQHTSRSNLPSARRRRIRGARQGSLRRPGVCPRGHRPITLLGGADITRSLSRSVVHGGGRRDTNCREGISCLSARRAKTSRRCRFKSAGVTRLTTRERPIAVRWRSAETPASRFSARSERGQISIMKGPERRSASRANPARVHRSALSQSCRHRRELHARGGRGQGHTEVPLYVSFASGGGRAR